MFYMSVQKADACTRAVYIGPDHMVVTGRTMDWKEDIMSNIYVFPRGIQRAGYNKENDREMDFKIRQRHCNRI